MRLTRGFTLIELMVTVVVLGLLMTIAVPSFTDMIRNHRSLTAADELTSALNLARVEAVKRGKRVSICPSTNGTSCSGTSWQGGWITFVDAAASDTSSTASVATGGVINRRVGMPTGATATGTASFIRFSGLGYSPISSNILVKVTSCTGNSARTISVSASGRIAVQKTAC